MAKSNIAAAPVAPTPEPQDLIPQIEQSNSPQVDVAPPAPAVIKARVLVAGPHGECNDVIEIDTELAATLAGTIDTDPAAVAYAKSLIKE